MTEFEYWDRVAEKALVDNAISDNWSKRRFLMQFLSKVEWRKKRVLEIGVGAGITAAALWIFSGGFHYTGTDVSKRFCDYCRKQWNFNVVNTDILHLPEGKFDRILALDTLEHVHPDDRSEGYRAIVDRMADNGLLFINMPMSVSGHDDEFDHGIGLYDCLVFEELGLTLLRWEKWELQFSQTGKCSYAWVVMRKEADESRVDNSVG